MSKQVIEKLEKLNWQFRIGHAFPVTEFKSPRLTQFYLICAEEFQLNEILDMEKEAYLNERLKQMDLLYDKARAKLLTEWDLILQKDPELPDEVTVNFKFKK